jgi:hypothetical protein
MQLKVYVYSAFKSGVGHLPNKNFEILGLKGAPAVSCKHRRGLGLVEEGG